jgi:hypothetical protein
MRKGSEYGELFRVSMCLGCGKKCNKAERYVVQERERERFLRALGFARVLLVRLCGKKEVLA